MMDELLTVPVVSIKEIMSRDKDCSKEVRHPACAHAAPAALGGFRRCVQTRRSQSASPVCLSAYGNLLSFSSSDLMLICFLSWALAAVCRFSPSPSVSIATW